MEDKNTHTAIRQYERERERVKSLRDFDLKFYNFNSLKALYFDSAFLVFKTYV
jgi:hypothetical protein